MRTFKSQIDGIIFYPQLVAATSVMLYSLWVGYVVLWILSMLWTVFLIAKIIGTEYVILDEWVRFVFGRATSLPVVSR